MTASRVHNIPNDRGRAAAGLRRGRHGAGTLGLGNQITRWEGGVQTLDGPTKALFGGGDIPHIWTGRLVVETSWTLPDE